MRISAVHLVGNAGNATDPIEAVGRDGGSAMGGKEMREVVECRCSSAQRGVSVLKWVCVRGVAWRGGCARCTE